MIVWTSTNDYQHDSCDGLFGPFFMIDNFCNRKSIHLKTLFCILKYFLIPKIFHLPSKGLRDKERSITDRIHVFFHKCLNQLLGKGLQIFQSIKSLIPIRCTSVYMHIIQRKITKDFTTQILRIVFYLVFQPMGVKKPRDH